MPVPTVIANVGRTLMSPFRQTEKAAPPPPEKAAPPPPTRGYPLSVTGGTIPTSWPQNWWQLGYDPIPGSRSAVVYACIAAYAQTIAMCPGTHWRSTGDGGRERVANSALSRFLKKPNAYQSASDFFIYMTTCLYGEGEAFGLALRNQRFEITEIHLMDPRMCRPRVAATGEVFYALGGNEVVDRLFADEPRLLQFVPARNVLHLRLPDPRHPLRGMPPLEAANLEILASSAIAANTSSFAANQARPSGVLETDEAFDDNEEAIAQLRAAWDKQTKGENAGGTPILTHGLKWKPAIVTSRDAQVAELLQANDLRIATAYRVPLPLLSLTEPGPQASTESLMQFWVATGLGFCANHIEDPIGRLFGLSGWPDEYLELDMEALLRANFKDRIEGLARGVQGGIYAPNEARAREDLPNMPFGDEPRVQQQVVPLSAWAKTPPATPAPDAPPPSPPGDPNADGGSSQLDWAKLIFDAAERHDRAV